MRVALIPNNTEVVFIHSDVFEWNFPENKYDLVVTNFFLDCFNFDELKKLINKISISLKPKGKLMYGDFNVPNSFLKKAITLPILGIMYLFFRITTGISTNKLIDPTLLLIENGFTLLNNGCWIVKGHDPNNTIWYTIDDAIDSILKRDINDTVNRVNSGNTISVDDAMTFLGQRYQFSTTIESKCIRLLISELKKTLKKD